MPIKYVVSEDGHFVHAVAEGLVTDEEFIDYEMTHATDPRVKPPFRELLEIPRGSFRQVTREAIAKVPERRNQLNRSHVSHSCAIVVAYDDDLAWDLAKFYEGMAILHSPRTVIVFGDVAIARKWLGVDKD